MQEENFHEKLKKKMDEYVHFVYKITRKFPKEELFGTTSQIRRSALSVILNYIEGFAREGKKSYLNFLRNSYASLKESKYLLYFSFKENYLDEKDYEIGVKMAEEIGAMLWQTIRKINHEITESHNT